MWRFLLSSFAMLFDWEFWKYAIYAFVTFFLFSFFVRYVAKKTRNKDLQKIFLLYPVIATVSIIPIVTFIQFYTVVESLSDNTFGLLGLGMNVLAYFYLNVILGLFWIAIDKCIMIFKGEKK